ncbi:hypothetical protein GGD46_002963 [Rhizobium lusitanum]|uniref:Uncharacterized protein n=1 Tax=Rhizobium lusitanum TaxID=293958 RepID=A0A7X0IRG9_9HYPH|nr:hypothetical protein [Rhizobium lusitanum]
MPESDSPAFFIARTGGGYVALQQKAVRLDSKSLKDEDCARGAAIILLYGATGGAPQQRQATRKARAFY